MAEDVVFHHNARSRSQIVHWMLEECGAPYRIVPMAFGTEPGQNRSAEFLAINPMGKLPTIVHRGTTVTETAAICLYLADAFPASGLAPALDDPLRGTYYRWMVFPAAVYEPALLDVMMKRPEVPRATAGHGTFDDAVAGFRAALSNGPYVLGDRFSAVDVYVGSQLRFSTMFGAPLVGDEPLFRDYLARLDERPAFQRTQHAG